MHVDLKTQLEGHLTQALKKAFIKEKLPAVEFQIPPDKAHGDFATNVAMQSAKILKKPPTIIAQEFVKIFEKSLEGTPFKNKIVKFEVKNPGFINIFLQAQAIFGTVEQILKKGEHYGETNFGQNKKYQIEFVSANPTGPLSVAHARQAAVGDALGNILEFIGFKVDKEFYVNDEGNQINILGSSIKLRALEILGQPVVFPEDHYQGDYIKDMAQTFMDQNRIKEAGKIESIPPEKFRDFGVSFLMAVIKKELNDFGVHFDVWSHQSKIATTKAMEDVLAFLRKQGFIYDHEGAVWFKSSAFGDDKDRVVKKSDGNFTYLMPDIVYHRNKFERGYERVINIWGPDHHGYIPRLKAAVEALGKNKEQIEVLIVQLATLFKDGQPLSMSTRRGQYISLREVLTEVGSDAARYFFLMRHIKSHLEFDLDLAKKQSSENPVYYIQYAHARVYSINKKAQEAHIKMKSSSLSLLTTPEELDLIRKMSAFSESLTFCYDQLDPYPLVNYLHELAISFHKFYDLHRVVDENKELSSERLALVNAARIILGNGLRLLGVSQPQQM